MAQFEPKQKGALLLRFFQNLALVRGTFWPKLVAHFEPFYPNVWWEKFLKHSGRIMCRQSQYVNFSQDVKVRFSDVCFLVARSFFRLAYNGHVYGVVWRFEAQTCQTATKFIRCNTLEISTIRQMHYTRCCVFVLYSPLSACVLGQPYSLTSFGQCVGFLSDLAMCMVAKGWHLS